MSLELTKRQEMVQKAAADFAAKTLEPIAYNADRAGEYPADVMKEIGQLGYMGLVIPKEYGGIGADAVTFSLYLEEIAKSFASVSSIAVCHSYMAAMPIIKYGTDEAKNKYLQGMAKGEILGGYAVAEPGAALACGADKVTASLSGDSYTLNGKKSFAVNGGVAGVYVVAAQTNEEMGTKGISMFVVDADADGLKVVRNIDKLGLRAYPTVELEFDNVQVSAANLLCSKDEGMKVLTDIIAHVDIANAAVAAGIGQRALDNSMDYAKTRVQFGAPIAKIQAVQAMISDMAANLYYIRLGAYNAAKTIDIEGNYKYDAAVMKSYIMKAGQDLCMNAVQVHGGTGYCRDYIIERLFRDMKGTYIVENSFEFPFKTIFQILAE